ncbi:MAG: hypothetical protein WBO37_05040, partial [Gammaproteobacteria bacterium]
MPLEVAATRRVEASKVPAKSAPRARRRRRAQPGVRERMFFTEQLSLLLETGTPLHAALKA